MEQLAAAVREACPEAVFALLHGSARDGQIGPGRDVNVALFLAAGASPSPDLYPRAAEVVRSVLAEADIGILNRAEPIYQFEALKGRLLFCRDREAYLSFFTRTCRRYEEQMADYQRQWHYRRAAATVAGEGDSCPG